MSTYYEHPTPKTARDLSISIVTHVWADRAGYPDYTPVYPDPNLVWPYGDWTVSDNPAFANYVVIETTLYSDYSGCGVERSNLRTLLQEYASDADSGDYSPFVLAEGGHGTRVLMLPADYSPPVDEDGDPTNDLLARLQGLTEYPLLSEEDYSELEMEVAEEAWEQYLESDVMSELEDKVVAAGEDLDEFVKLHEGNPPIKSLFYEITYKSNEFPYMETSTNITFPNMDDTIDVLAGMVLTALRDPSNPTNPNVHGVWTRVVDSSPLPERLRPTRAFCSCGWKGPFRYDGDGGVAYQDAEDHETSPTGTIPLPLPLG